MSKPSKLDAAIEVIKSCQHADRVAGLNADYHYFPRQIVAAAGDILAAYEAIAGGVSKEDVTLLKRQLAAANARVAKLTKGAKQNDEQQSTSLVEYAGPDAVSEG